MRITQPHVKQYMREIPYDIDTTQWETRETLKEVFTLMDTVSLQAVDFPVFGGKINKKKSKIYAALCQIIFRKSNEIDFKLEKMDEMRGIKPERTADDMLFEIEYEGQSYK